MSSSCASTDDHHPDGLASDAAGEGTERVFAAFAALSRAQQVLIWHVDVSGRHVDEVAALLDVAPEALSELLSEARAALRAHHYR